MKKNQKAFTLLEVMITVAIIAVLSIVSTISWQVIRMNARDQQRKIDLSKLKTALETYNSRFGYYPDENYNSDLCDSSRGGGAAACAPVGTTWNASSDLSDLNTQSLISSLPTDPLNSATYFYIFELDQEGEGTPRCPDRTGTDKTCRYVLQAVLENGDIITGGKGQCIYTVMGGEGNPQSMDLFNTTAANVDCKGNVVPTAWSAIPCCALPTQ